jgi:hypothetical protein
MIASGMESGATEMWDRLNANVRQMPQPAKAGSRIAETATGGAWSRHLLRIASFGRSPTSSHRSISKLCESR